jgi:hypothetical protein
MNSKARLRKEIRAAKTKLDGCAFGTPARETALQEFWALQGKLGRLEIAEHDAQWNSRKTPAFTVLGPDGVPIREKPFLNRAAAERGVAEFIKRFEVQGYYAGVGYRLELDEIAARCTVRECMGRE